MNFFKNWIGSIDKKGKVRHSFKKFGLALATLTVFVGPQILLFYDIITGEQWLDFYKVIFPTAATLYGGGKLIDFKVNGSG